MTITTYGDTRYSVDSMTVFQICHFDGGSAVVAVVSIYPGGWNSWN